MPLIFFARRANFFRAFCELDSLCTRSRTCARRRRKFFDTLTSSNTIFLMKIDDLKSEFCWNLRKLHKSICGNFVTTSKILRDMRKFPHIIICGKKTLIRGRPAPSVAFHEFCPPLLPLFDHSRGGGQNSWFERLYRLHWFSSKILMIFSIIFHTVANRANSEHRSD